MEAFETLTKESHRLLIDRLAQFGNVPSEAQKRALEHIVNTYSVFGNHIASGRIAYPLGPGTGKTTSVAAFARAVQDSGHEISFTVAASQVEHLAELKRNMIEMGVEPERIALVHSYHYTPEIARAYLEGSQPLPEEFASEPTTAPFDEIWKRQFCLVTHNRIRSRENIAEYMTFREAGNERDFLVWDESLIVSRTTAVNLRIVRKNLKCLEENKLTPDARAVISYGWKAVTIVEEELRWQEKDRPPQIIRLPELTDADRRLYIKALSNAGSPGETAALKTLLKMSVHDLSAGPTDQGSGVVFYKLTVPPDLSRVCILDASAPIRTLEKLDKSIKIIDTIYWKDASGRMQSQYLPALVDYSDVEIQRIKFGSGRTTLTEYYTYTKEKPRHLSREIADIVRSIPEEAPLLLFTHLPKMDAVDIRHELEGDLIQLGIDTKARVKVTVYRKGEPVQELKPKFNWLTHGSETGINQMSFCAHVVYIGLMWRNHTDALAAYRGQSDNLLAEASTSEVAKVVESEAAYAFHQGACRGACRIVKGTKALPMKVWVTDYLDMLRQYVHEVLPGCRWSWYPLRHLNVETKGERVERVILNWLNTKRADCQVMSIRKLKLGLRRDGIIGPGSKLGEVPQVTFWRALAEIDNDPGSGWLKHERSIGQAGYVLFTLCKQF